MEKVLEKIEGIIEGKVEEFEKNPVKTTLKLAIIYYVIKKIWDNVK